MKWEKVSLLDISEGGIMVDGDWIESKDQDPKGGIRLLQLADIGDGFFINKSKRYINKETAFRLRCTFIEEGDILIARMPDPIGRACIFPLKDDKNFITAVDVCILRVGKKANNRYVTHAINSSGFRNSINSLITGTTRQRITRKKLQELTIPLPPLHIQEQISDTLDKADALCRKDQELLTKYDKLAQAIFYDMFGDPEKNEKKWLQKPISFGVKAQGGYAFKSSDIVKEGIRLVKISNVSFEKIIWNELDYLPTNFYSKHSEFSLNEGDIVIALTRPIIKSLDTVKIARLRNNDIPSMLNQRVARFKIDKQKINPFFLLHFCYSIYFKNKIDSYCSTSLQPNISTNQIENILMYYPPLSLQHQFEQRITLVYESKRGVTSEYSLSLMNTLMNNNFS